MGEQVLKHNHEKWVKLVLGVGLGFLFVYVCLFLLMFGLWWLPFMSNE